MAAIPPLTGQRRLSRAVALVFAATVVALVGITLRAQQAPLVVSIDASKSGPTLNRHLFGQFAEHLGKGIYEGIWVGPDSPIPNTRGIRNDVVTALRALKVPNVRWPGGCFADEYHWRKGIGPLKDRPVTLNPNWGGVTEPNTFGSHEFLDFVEQIGAEPYLSINVGSGTPAEAADWLEYLTTDQQTALAKERAANGHPAPYRIPILGIGNESWDCGGNMSPEYYTSQLRVFSRFVRNFNPKQQGDDRMLKIAVGPGGGEPRFAEWTETVMKSWKGRQWSWDHMDGLSLHNYTVVRFPAAYKSVGFGEQEYAEILQDTLKTDRLIREHAAIMDRYDPEKTVALVVDEWGAWYAQLPGTTPGFLAQQNSVRDALIVALNIHTFSRYADRVRMANIAQMINVLQAMILTDGPRMVLTPTYHAFRMLVPFQGATVVPFSVDAGRYTRGKISLPRVDAMAARDASGTLWISLANVDPMQSVDIDTTLNGIAARSASGETLTGPAIDSVNTFDAPQVVVPTPATVRLQGNRLSITLPPKSMTVVGVRP